MHDALGFIAVAFVFAAADLNEEVAVALRSAGLNPDVEEFKSGVRMDANPQMRGARDALLEVVRSHTSLAVVFAPRHHSTALGKQCLQALQSVLVRNGIDASSLTVCVDERIFESPAEALRLQSLFRVLRPAVLRPSEDSRLCRGIQLADLIAHAFAQIVREGLTGKPKLFDMSEPEIEPPGSVRIPLSDFLLVGFRYNLLGRRMVSEGEDFDPATDPVVLGSDDDPTVYGGNPEIFGWGVQVAPEATEKLRRAVRHMLDRVWMGCWH